MYIIPVCTIPFFRPETGISRRKETQGPTAQGRPVFAGQGYINDRCPGTSSTLYSWTSKALMHGINITHSQSRCWRTVLFFAVYFTTSK